MTTSDADFDLIRNEDVYLECFKFLENIDLNSDNVPNIQYTPSALSVEVSSATNLWNDNKGYYSSFENELEFISKIENCVIRGHEFVHMLYTYRSVSQAIPEISVDHGTDGEELTAEEEQDIANRKADINRKVLDILRPEITKLKDLMLYILQAVNVFHSCVNHLTQKEQHKEMIPEGIYASLMKLMDILLILDNLKDIKTCLQKDFSRYKRVLGPHPSIEIIEELNSLQLFLSNPDPKKSKNYIFLSLRNEIKRINNHETILFEMLELANYTLENIFYLTPNEKFRLIRIQPYLMLIIDGDADDKQSLNVFKTNRIKLGTIQKLFRKNPVIPLYNDMTITLEYILQKASHYDKSIAPAWSSAGNAADPAMVQSYQLTTHWAAIKDSYTEFLLRLSMTVNRCEKYPFRKNNEDGVTREFSDEVYRLVCDGFQKLSKWNMLVQTMLAWKYTHPAAAATAPPDPPSHSSMAAGSGKAAQPTTADGTNTPSAAAASAVPIEGLEYARVIKHNFSKEELSVLVDVISCIKTLSSQLARHEALFAPYIRFHVHHSVQQLVQGDMVPLLHRVDKRNKPILSTLLKLRTIAADWAEGIENRNDYKEYSRSKGTNITVNTTPRVVGTSATQLYILRLQVNALCSEDSELKRRTSVFGKTDLEKSDMEIFTRFYEDSFYFHYLLNYSATLNEISSLSELWYREFFLEMTKCIQFPIEMSLPWILIEHLINTLNPSAPTTPSAGQGGYHQNAVVLNNNNMIENIFLVLDVYNDAAHTTLYKLHTQYLYDEIEAECNLVIDQLYFLLTDVIFNHYKCLAASDLIEKSYKYKLEEIKSANHLTVATQHFETILKQKHVQLLGRSINFNFILGQNINNKLYREIDFAIKRFESSDARGVIDLKQFLDILLKTHEYLTTQGTLQLDDFPLMLAEINESFTPSIFRGRISMHMLTSLVRDVLPNYSYNSYTERFIPSPIALRPMDPPYGKPPKMSTIIAAYGGAAFHKVCEMQSKLTRGFFGQAHMKVFLSLGITLSDITMVIDQLIQNLLDKLKDIAEYLEALKDSVPPCKPLPFLYHAIGSYGYYEGKLRALLAYDDLKPEVFQNFREVGNSIAFLKDLSNLLDVQTQFDFNFIAPLLGITPSVSSGTGATSTATAPVALTTTSPLETIVSHLHAEVNASPALLHNVVRSVDVFNRLPAMVHRQVENATTLFANGATAANGSKESRPVNKTLLKYVLLQIEDFLFQESLTEDWAVHPPAASSTATAATKQQHGKTSAANSSPNNAAIEINNSKGFHRLYSALSFLFNMTETSNAVPLQRVNEEGEEDVVEEQQVSNEAEFGHGFTITGCLLMHLLGQRGTFELMDFSSYVLKVAQYDEHSEYNAQQAAQMAQHAAAGQHSVVDTTLLSDTNSFVANASTHQKLQMELFALFEAQYQVRDAIRKNTTNKTVYHPPVEEEFL